MKTFFLSLKTTVWTLFALVCLFFVGSYMMPVHRAVFAPMNEDILLNWVRETAVMNLGGTWWFFACLGGLVLLTVNTLVCSLQAIRGKWSRVDFVIRISPQVVHIGFLFILLAHLLGAGWGYKLSGMMPEGSFARLPENRTLYLQQIRVQADAAGYVRDWAAQVSLFENDRPVKSGVLGPNKPLLYRGVGIYLKSLNYERGSAAIIHVAKDPGAIWALAGSILFMLGTITLLIVKWKRA
jgi:cytochrome c biogenesis protein ResB